MTFERAVMIAHYGLACPKEVNPCRWRAMLRQIEAVYGYGWLAKF